MTRPWPMGAFDVAPPSRTRPPWVWALLGASCFACAMTVLPVQRVYSDWELARSHLAAAQQSAQQEAAEHRLRAAQSQSQAVQDRNKYRMAVEQAIHVSWDGIFDTLEWAAQSVNASVSIVSLTPTKVQGDATQIRITALATEQATLLHYLEVLKQDPRVIQADLVNQHPEEKAGPKVIRFRVDATLNTRLPRPVRPPVPVPEKPNPGASNAALNSERAGAARTKAQSQEGRL